jgi:hypothetical protein
MWNRTRRLQATPFIARTNSNISAAATAMAQQNATPQADATPIGKDKKSSEPLFGPSIGSVTNGPAWTLSTEKKVVTDELTPDIVSTWIEKSKEVSGRLLLWRSLLPRVLGHLRRWMLDCTLACGADVTASLHALSDTICSIARWDILCCSTSVLSVSLEMALQCNRLHFSSITIHTAMRPYLRLWELQRAN